MAAALRLMSALAGYGEDDGTQPEPLPTWGVYRTYPATGEQVVCSAVLVFYRAHLQASDMAGVERLATVLAGQGCTVAVLFVTSLKDHGVAQGVAEYLRRTKPDVVLNATCFSARGGWGVPRWMRRVRLFCRCSSRAARRPCGLKAHAAGALGPCYAGCSART